MSTKSPQNASAGDDAFYLDPSPLTVLDRLCRMPKGRVEALLLLLVLGVGYVDHLAGEQFSLSVFYLPLVSLTCWVAGLRVAISFSLLCSLLWLVDDLFLPEVPPPDVVKYWHTIMRFITFVAFAVVLSRLKQALTRERALARHDLLTGLFNRQGFYEAASQELARCRRHPRPLSILFFDCDRFKQVNDTLGHDAGDALLRVIGATLRRELRQGDVAGRVGGDEFVVLFSDADEAAALAAVNKLREALRDAMRGHDWPVTFSMGLVTCYRLPRGVDDLLREADALMYEVKRGSRDAVRQACIGVPLQDDQAEALLELLNA